MGFYAQNYKNKSITFSTMIPLLYLYIVKEYKQTTHFKISNLQSLIQTRGTGIQRTLQSPPTLPSSPEHCRLTLSKTQARQVEENNHLHIQSHTSGICYSLNIGNIIWIHKTMSRYFVQLSRGKVSTLATTSLRFVKFFGLQNEKRGCGEARMLGTHIFKANLNFY